ncbi:MULTISPECIES: AAA family ATPase [Pseudofrankia]|uniref:AAA family ATPase n=1 Tax=Pseudofrankia TaxID=2994363 RepID=UPI000234C8C9|nr:MULTISPECIES: AAA family ATPase [Pseudofrankia]OHV35831.1 transcriptional regulator [Pseudofrankia sp. EUN1h]
MTRYRHGFIVGKFYPPHQGHRQLIDTAARTCDEVTVLVEAGATETIPLADRMAWLRETHADTPHVTVIGISCDVPVDMANPTVWTAQVEVMRAALRQHGRPPIDAVLSSEAYGDELAARLGARAHVPVDPGRERIPVSATRVRADLAAGWDLLEPPVRAGLTCRIVVVGAESTGTTTISRTLAEHYRARGGAWARTRWVEEFGRELTERKWAAERAAAAKRGERPPELADITWTADDFDEVGGEQTRRENAAALAGSPLLVCDTDAFATMIWERRYLGPDARPPRPWATNLPPRALYLVTDHRDVPWEDDGMREGDLDIRATMTTWFIDALTVAGHSWIPLTGPLPDRLDLAIRAVDAALARAATFGPPAG